MTFTEQLRADFLKTVSANVCKHCGRGEKLPTHRILAKKVGVHENAMWRFLKGKPISQETIDSIYEFVHGDGLLDGGRKKRKDPTP